MTTIHVVQYYFPFNKLLIISNISIVQDQQYNFINKILIQCIKLLPNNL